MGKNDSDDEENMSGRSGKRSGKNPKKKGNDDSDDSDDSSDDNGGGRTGKRKGRNPNKKANDDGDDDANSKMRRRKPKKSPLAKEYKIFFSVDIRIKDEDDLADKIKALGNLKTPFCEIFETDSPADIFDISTRVRPGNTAFQLKFGMKIATEKHPADYINIFDELSSKKNPKIQEGLIEAFDFDNDPEIHVWEARYEKLEKKK